MPYKARQFLKSGDKTYAPGEIVPGVENSPNLFDLLRTNYLYYTDEQPKFEPQEPEKQQTPPNPKGGKKTPNKKR